MKKQNKSYIYSLIAVFFWSTVAAVFKLTLEGMTFSQMLFYSSLVSTIVLGSVLIKQNQKNLRNVFCWKSLKMGVLVGFINPFFYYLILFKAYDLLPAHEAQILNFVWPVVLSIFAIIFLKQKFSVHVFIGLIAAFIGVIIIITHGNIFTLQFTNLFGSLLALSTAIIWAAFWLFNLKDKRETLLKLFSSFFFGTFFSAIYLFFFDSFVVAKSEALLGTVYIGLFEMGLTFLMWLKGLELSDNKPITSTLAFLAPFLSLIIIAIVLSETIPLSSIIGFGFILGGIVYQQLGKNIK